MRILEEFWYGNIEPTEYDTIACKEYKEVLRLITRNEEKLLATMTDEQKELHFLGQRVFFICAFSFSSHGVSVAEPSPSYYWDFLAAWTGSVSA